MSETIFVVLTILLLYIYAGYPLALCLLARLFPQRHVVDERAEPSVTLIISAYNEQNVIAAKLMNSLALDYPAGKLDVVVVSDCSSDRTDSIVRGFAGRGVKLVRTAERRGKTSGLNCALKGISSDIVLFSDANALYDRSAVRRLVRHFADPAVGYAVGWARYEDAAETAAGRSEGAYWDMEVRLKQWESSYSSVVGGDGAIYAIRTMLYEPLLESDINDFVNPLQIVARGYRGVFDAEAWCSEKVAGRFDKEFARKVRIVNRSFNGLLRVPRVCNPWQNGRFAWQVISHKLLRWFSPFILCCHFTAAVVAMSDGPVGVLASTAVCGYGAIAVLALAGGMYGRSAVVVGFRFIPHYFVIMNVALATGILLRLKGRVITVWETVRGGGLNRDVTMVRVHLLLVSVLCVSLAGIAMAYGIDRTFVIGSAYALLFILFSCFQKPALRGGAV